MLRIAAATLAAATLAAAWRAPGDTRPNLILFYPDTIRADALGTYGHPLTRTPNMDRMASQSVLFEQAHVQHSQCSPSRCALVTGRYLHVNGHRTQTHLVQPSEPNAFGYLKTANYSTLLLGKNDVFASASFNSSLTFWEGDIGVSTGASPFKMGEAGYYSFAAGPGKAVGNNSAQNGDLRAVELVADFLASDPQEPFAIWLTGIGGHPPYGAPRDYQEMYSAEEVQAAAPLRPVLPGKPSHIAGPASIGAYRNLTSFNDTFFYGLAAVYLGRMSYVDYVLGQLMDALDALPALNASTVLIFHSDHGDYSGTWPQLVEKYPGALEDALTHVPLMIRAPGGASGVRVAAPVMSIDLLPTLLELANVTATDRHFGLSLAPFLRPGADPAAVPVHDFVFSEAGYSPGTMEVEPLDPAQASVYKDPSNYYYPRGREEVQTLDAVRAVMIRNASAKMVYRPPPSGFGAPFSPPAGPGAVAPVSELYDLTADPLELHNLFGQPSAAALQAELMASLLRWFIETAGVTPAAEDDRGLPPAPVPPFPWPPQPRRRAA